jgi:hypothetical protein
LAHPAFIESRQNEGADDTPARELVGAIEIGESFRFLSFVLILETS